LRQPKTTPVLTAQETARIRKKIKERNELWKESFASNLEIMLINYGDMMRPIEVVRYCREVSDLILDAFEEHDLDEETKRSPKIS